MRRLVEFFEIEKRRENGVPVKRPSLPSETEIKSLFATDKPQPGAICISAASEEYKAEKRISSAWVKKTEDRHDAVMRLLLEWLGDVKVSSVSHMDL